MTAPVRLGIAGGPIVMGILIGALGPRVHFISYMTRSAGLMLRELGLALYLGCLGLAAGGPVVDINISDFRRIQTALLAEEAENIALADLVLLSLTYI